MRAGDLIIDVDGVEAYGAELDLVTQRIQGEEGTTVELGVWREVSETTGPSLRCSAGRLLQSR